MARDGVRRALAFVTSAFSSYSSCRQYLENIQSAREQVGDQAPVIDKLRAFYNHPGFIEAQAEQLSAALAGASADRRDRVRVLFTAHSIPLSMAETSDYEVQLREACRLTAERCGGVPWRLVYQSRSGSPTQPWLAPDVGDAIREAAAGGSSPEIVISPIGFLSDHVEVLYDLDVEARGTCDELGLSMIRTATVGTHPRFVGMIRELLEERLDPSRPRLAIGEQAARPNSCASDCCRYEPRPRA
jgi:ferrochelatase